MLAALFHEFAVAADYALGGKVDEGRVAEGRFKFNKTVVVRALGFMAAGAALGAALVTAGALRGPSRATVAAPQGTVQPDGKDQSRLALRSRKQAPQQGAPGGGPGESAPLPETSVENPPRPAANAWREDVFTAVRVLDGRTLGAGAVAIRMADLDLPDAEQVCRTLDNRLEQCTARAATQLELLTRSRTVSCRYQMTTSSEAVGSCRIGSSDLAERMIRTGYVRRAAGSSSMAMAEAGRN